MDFLQQYNILWAVLSYYGKDMRKFEWPGKSSENFNSLIPHMYMCSAFRALFCLSSLGRQAFLAYGEQNLGDGDLTTYPQNWVYG